MPLSLSEQLDLGIKSITYGDIDLFSTMLTDPQSVTLDEQKTVAQKLGVKGGLLSAFVNVVGDPTVWLAYMMSRRFPTQAWLTGKIPNRFIGGAAEFTGISWLGRPIESFHRGTRIPKLTALAERREMEVMKVARKWFDEIENRPNWQEEKGIVSLIREGQNPSAATPELRRVANKLDDTMKEMWGFLNKAHKIDGGFGETEVSKAISSPRTGKDAPKFLRDYLPHIPLTTNDSVIEFSGRDALRRLGRGGNKQAAALKRERFEDVWTPTEVDGLASDFVRYQGFMNNVGTEVYNRHLFQRKRFNIPLQSALKS